MDFVTKKIEKIKKERASEKKIEEELKKVCSMIVQVLPKIEKKSYSKGLGQFLG